MYSKFVFPLGLPEKKLLKYSSVSILLNNGGFSWFIKASYRSNLCINLAADQKKKSHLISSSSQNIGKFYRILYYKSLVVSCFAHPSLVFIIVKFQLDWWLMLACLLVMEFELQEEEAVNLSQAGSDSHHHPSTQSEEHSTP